jgi:hypothetical protein
MLGLKWYLVHWKQIYLISQISYGLLKNVSKTQNTLFAIQIETLEEEEEPPPRHKSYVPIQLTLE